MTSVNDITGEWECPPSAGGCGFISLPTSAECKNCKADAGVRPPELLWHCVANGIVPESEVEPDDPDFVWCEVCVLVYGAHATIWDNDNGRRVCLGCFTRLTEEYEWA